MTPPFSHLFHQICKYFKMVESSKTGELHPENLVRLCRSRAEFIIIINEAINHPNQSWNQELINRFIQYVFEEENSGISVYSASTLDPLDRGHAFAVIAEGISQECFRSSRGSKRRSGCTRGTLIIPTSCLPKTTYYDFTPENNLNFHPANQHHFDLTTDNVEELAIALLNGIKQRVIKWSFLGNDNSFKGTYLFQAAIAYSHCLQTSGKLNPSVPPSDWIDGETITASEQIDTLKHLAKAVIVMFDSPDPPKS